MNLLGNKREEPEVNLTSLIDVVLLLLIFFMVSTSFISEAELKIQLPESELDPAPVETDNLEIIVTVQGTYLVNRREVVNSRPETLRRAILEMAGDDREQVVTIRADANATHQAVVTAMDVAGRLGFHNISIATVNASE